MKILRLIYNLAILAVFIIGIIKLFQKEYYLAFIWIIITPILMLLPRNLYKITWVNKGYNKSLLYLFEIFILILTFNAVGFAIGIKDIPIDYDSYAHFFNAIIHTILFAVSYYIIKNKITGKEIKTKEIILVAFILNILFGVVLWEKFQMLNDNLFGTNMYFDHFQDADYDSMLDQVYGSLGTLFASILMYFKFDDWLNKWKR